MKPLKLTVKNIGPFRDQTIDFTALGDMFLICGKTGAGKTTIFDAITYALYGKLPGARSTVNVRRLRSDFAAPDEEAFVTLEYVLNGERFSVTRILPCPYVNRNGKISEKPEEVMLCRMRDGLEEPVSGTISELNAAITGSIGLSHDEFARIVLLPQGEFADFLRQSSAERRDTLAKLFPTQIYADCIERAKEKSNALGAELDSIVKQQQQFGADYEPSADKTLLEQLNGALERCQCERSETQQRIIALENDRIRAEEQLRVFAEAERLRQKLALLETERPAIEQERETLELAAEAEPIAAAADEADRAERAAETVRTQLAQTRLQQNAAEDALRQLTDQENDVECAREKYSQAEFLRLRLEEAVRAERELTDAVWKQLAAQKSADDFAERIRSLETRRTEIEEQLESPDFAGTDEDRSQQLAEKRQQLKETYRNAEETAKRAAQKRETEDTIGRIHTDYALRQQKARAAAERSAEAKRGVEAYLERQTHAEHAQYARILAGALADGCPCPVCGAREHPAIAGTARTGTEADDAPDTAELDRLKAEAAEAEKASAEETAHAARLEGTLAQLQTTLDAMENVPDPAAAAERLESAAAAVRQIESEYAGALDAFRRKRELQGALRRVQDELEPLRTEFTRQSVALAQTRTESDALRTLAAAVMQQAQKAGYTADTAAKTAESVRAALDRLQTYLDTFAEAKREAEKQLAQAAGSIEQLTAQTKIRETEARQAAERFGDLLARTDFPGADAVRAAILPAAEKAERAARVERWKTEYAETAALLRETEAAAVGVTRQPERELAQLEDALASARETLAAAEKTYQDTLIALEQVKARIGGWNALEARRLETARTAGLYRQLFNDISGKNPRKIALDSWVLGIYLEEITAYASSRLHRISDGRYTLLLNQDTGGSGAKGLDLEILDAYTGKKRPCGTLSGGETFMASISLALALTDVVRNRAGGITLDALFIDEGFGSLDEASLEKALAILDEIRGTRCVGLISHVPGMRSRIPTRLEVIKTAVGSEIRTVFTQADE